ncbi:MULTISPECIES: formate dehydrogenase subunit delta [unclassified Crossiella]|uniref:formate dehydrogenase subunit delta n=1 Tax=unclassified Crossiella TaxID=2620835 RepID=UPI0020003DC1|nr:MULTISPECIES: formate dehydrogenase subunit delta [unclassified Crossiella]MCK2239818.1 formate dehydrogenase subunit delta [Crossiella sp. S99.2]MCK2252513.1 formate dehydrogenase subunit delta [Crossiella sp. S99.1]
MSTTSQSPQVRLINEIALQFEGQPVSRAATAIAEHIRSFWDPRMRADLNRQLLDNPGALSPLALSAAKLLRH